MVIKITAFWVSLRSPATQASFRVHNRNSVTSGPSLGQLPPNLHGPLCFPHRPVLAGVFSLTIPRVLKPLGDAQEVFCTKASTELGWVFDGMLVTVT